MRHWFYISSLLCSLLWMASCTGPVILDEPATPDTETEKGEETHTRDSVPIIHEGTYASPYSIGEALTLGRGKNVWVEGYIVGCVSGSMKNGCDYSAMATTTSNILLADTFPTGDEYDYLYCMPVELPSNSLERDELNLYDNPDNYHRKLRIEGDITLYYKVPGIKEVNDYIFENENEDGNEDESENENENENNNEDDNEPERPNDPNATRQDTLSIAEGIKLQDKGEQVYIRGYIVGYYNGSSMMFHPTVEQVSSRANSNIMLADSTDETDWRNVIIVELPTGTALRSKVNLYDNPKNLHHRLTVKGMLREYKDDTGYYGCMGTLSKLGEDEDYYFLLE